MANRGMENKGALCYMIAPLQQLLSIPALVAAAAGQPQPQEAGVLLPFLQRWQANAGPEDDSNFAVDLWRVLYGDKEGDVFTQRDAGECYADLVAKLCNDLKGTQNEATVTRQLVGQLSNILEERDFTDSSHRMLRAERFFHISLSVNPLDGNNRLESALADFTRVEQIPFRWPVNSSLTSIATAAGAPRQLGQPVPSTKTTKFTALPAQLVFHLKRFRFDVKSMQKVKLHHRFEFPALLDMRPYLQAQDSANTTYSGANNCNSNSKEGPSSTSNVIPGPDSVAPAQMMYRLCGVVVHRGRTAYEGHYYSFIRDKACADVHDTAATVVPAQEAAGAASEDVERAAEDLGTALRGQRWYRFDDAEVSEVGVARLARETFGGEWEASDDEDSSSSSSSGCSSDGESSGDSDGCGDSNGSEVNSGVGEATERNSPAAEALHGTAVVDLEGDAAADRGAAAPAMGEEDEYASVEVNEDLPLPSDDTPHSLSSNRSEERCSESEENSAQDNEDSNSYDSNDSSEDGDEYASAFMLFYERIE